MPADATGNITIKAIEVAPSPPWLLIALAAFGGAAVIYFAARLAR